MALEDKDITAGQERVIGPLISNFQTANARLASAQQAAAEAQAIVEEYVSQIAEKLSIDITKEYSFDIVKRKFTDRATIVAAAEALKEKS